MELKSGGYKCRKWSVFTLCLVNIIAIIAALLIVIRVTTLIIEGPNESMPEDFKKQDKNDLKSGWEILKTILIVCSVVAVLVHIFGLFSALKEHFYLVVTYAVLNAILCIAYIVAKSEVAHIYITLFWSNLPLSILSFIYSYDIYQWKHSSEQSNNLTSINNQLPQLGHPNPTLPTQLFPGNLNQMESNQTYYTSQASANQTQANLDDPNPTSLNHTFPSNDYPAQLQLGQMNEQVMLTSMHNICYPPIDSQPPPYDFLEKMSPKVN